MKKMFVVIAVLALVLSACGSDKAKGIPITVYRSPT